MRMPGENYRSSEEYSGALFTRHSHLKCSSIWLTKSKWVVKNKSPFLRPQCCRKQVKSFETWRMALIVRADILSMQAKPDVPTPHIIIHWWWGFENHYKAYYHGSIKSSIIQPSQVNIYCLPVLCFINQGIINYLSIFKETIIKIQLWH